MLVNELKQRVMDGECLSEQQAIALLGEDREALYEAAHEITLNFMGNKFDTCSIIITRQRRSFIRFCQRRNVSAMRFITGSRE